MRSSAWWPVALLMALAPTGCERRTDDQSREACKTPSPVSDSFDGDGPLQGYKTNNADSLPTVRRVAGRYHAKVLHNRDEVTLHYMDQQGRLDAKLVCFPFEYIARNIGIGTVEDPLQAPPHRGEPFVFAGVQVHTTDLAQANSSHIVVGHRGHTGFTVEGKNTVDGVSTVDDVGANMVPEGRADLRVLGSADRTLTIYWQPPNPEPGKRPDRWRAYRGTGRLPGRAPRYDQQVYVGLITYAYRQEGLPFVGTCDGVELVSEGNR